MNKVQIATLADLAQEQLAGAEVAGIDLVAVACGDNFTVFEGRCPHQGTLLSEGYVEDGRLVCRGHGWQFQCPSGLRVDDDQICLHQFSCAIEDGRLLVDQTEVTAWAEQQRTEKATVDKAQFLSPEQLPGPPGLPVIGNLHQMKVDDFTSFWKNGTGNMATSTRSGWDHNVLSSAPTAIWCARCSRAGHKTFLD